MDSLASSWFQTKDNILKVELDNFKDKLRGELHNEMENLKNK